MQGGFARRLPYLALLAAGVAAVPALATGVTVDQLEANGSYSLGGSAPTTLQQALPLNPVDVLAFPVDGVNTAGIHSYGQSLGFFGTRSSGGGIYDVTSSFLISETITNDSAHARNATFTFTISPGFILNSIGSPITGSQYVTAGLGINVKRDNATIYGSAASLTTTSSGTVFSASGDTSLYAGSDTYYYINGADLSVDLGVIAPGASFTLTYTLSSFANGFSVAGGPGFDPGGDYYVPAQVKLAGAPAPSRFRTVLISPNVVAGGPVPLPAHTVIVPPQGVVPGVGQSFASIGDPFDVTFAGLPVFIGRNAGPGLAGITLTDVPEPATWAMMLAGFFVIGATTRSRRRALAA